MKNKIKSKKKYTKHGYSLEDLVSILDKVIPIYKSSNVISYHQVLSNHCTYNKTHWDYILRKDPEKIKDIIDRFNILRDIQEEKIIEGAMSNRINTTFSIFFLKAQRGWVEQQHKDRLQYDYDKLEKETHINNAISNNVIEVGFGGGDETETED